MPDWDAEVVIDEALVRTLLAEQFPDIDPSSARLLAEGWDYSVWVVAERWAFRFTRREVSIPGIRRELEVLPRLAPLLSVPVPEPHFVGAPTDRFPWPFFGAPFLAGVEPAEAGLDDAGRIALGAELGRVLRSLHSRETLQLVDPNGALPVDVNRRSDMTFRVPRARENLAALTEGGVWRPRGDVEAIFAAAAAAAPIGDELVLVHGDLHQRNVLVERSGALAGIVDWVDVCRADPCVDLVPFWSLLTYSARERFLEAYGQVSDDRLLRSRVLAIGLDSMLALYAREVGNEPLEREALAALDRALVDH